MTAPSEHLEVPNREQAVEVIDEHEGTADDLHTATEADGGEHGTGAFPPFDPSTFGTQLLWLALAFGALYAIMSRVALPRIGEILETRRDRIEGDLAEAERLRQKTDQAIAAYEQALAEARRHAQGIAEETRMSIKADLDSRRAGVEADLGTKLTAAEARIQQTKTAALANVDEIAAETAQALVAQLIGTVSLESARNAVAAVAAE